MNYLGRPDYSHGSPSRCGVLLVNLGTPDATTASALRRYLAEFLADPRVIELPRVLWLPLLYGVILPLRSPRSARAYRKVWTDQGSPLRSNSEAIASALTAQLNASGQSVEVKLAMRYGSPSVAGVLDQWHRQGLRRLLVLPLYPQYSATTTASVFDAIYQALGRWRWQPELRLITDYADSDRWVQAVAQSIRSHWEQHGRADRLMFSFHGIPQRYLRAGDPYFCQSHASARRIAAALELAEEEWILSFQSRVGREEWLRPYTDEVLKTLPGEGVRTLDVVCPGFAADCLETLEEIAMQNAELFVESGGQTLRYIPALNAAPAHIEALAELVQRHGQGWPEFDGAAALSALERNREDGRRAFEAYSGPQKAKG